MDVHWDMDTVLEAEPRLNGTWSQKSPLSEYESTQIFCVVLPIECVY